MKTCGWYEKREITFHEGLLGVESSSFAKLLEEARKHAVSLRDGVSRFECLRLLDGLQMHAEGSITVTDAFLLLEVLYRHFASNPWEVDRTRNEFISSLLVSYFRDKGYSLARIEPKLLLADSVPVGWIYPALASLCRKGLIVQDAGESFFPAKGLWRQEIEMIKTGLGKLVSGFREIEESRSSNYPSLTRDYWTQLAKSDELADALRVFGQKKPGEQMHRRNGGERIHLTKHHAGPWICKMAGDQVKFLQGTIDMLPSDFGGSATQL